MDRNYIGNKEMGRETKQTFCLSPQKREHFVENVSSYKVPQNPVIVHTDGNTVNASILFKIGGKRNVELQSSQPDNGTENNEGNSDRAFTKIIIQCMWIYEKDIRFNKIY